VTVQNSGIKCGFYFSTWEVLPEGRMGKFVRVGLLPQVQGRFLIEMSRQSISERSSKSCVLVELPLFLEFRAWQLLDGNYDTLPLMGG